MIGHIHSKIELMSPDDKKISKKICFTNLTKMTAPQT